jgi:hypothetical protein
MWGVCNAYVQSPGSAGELVQCLYNAIVQAVRIGALTEPFTKSSFRDACPGLGIRTERDYGINVTL